MSGNETTAFGLKRATSTGYIKGTEYDIRGQEFLKLNIDHRALMILIRGHFQSIDDVYDCVQNDPGRLMNIPMVGAGVFTRIKTAVEEYKREQVHSHDEWEAEYFAQYHS